jgi:hypothetical protein
MRQAPEGIASQVGAGAVRLISSMMCCRFMATVTLRDVFNLDLAPMLFEVFGNQAAMAVVWLFLAAEQASTVQNFARCVFDMPRPHQFKELPLV